jgi:nucleotide-binding universal stress UspA family protein
MTETMLVAIDHSDRSTRVIATAERFAKSAGAQIFIVHLRERENLGRLGLVADESEDEAKKKVAEAVEQLKSAGVTATGIVLDTLYGSVAKEIVESAKKQDASMIVMGTRGLGTLEGLVVGSTAHKVLHLADRPVLIVP